MQTLISKVDSLVVNRRVYMAGEVFECECNFKAKELIANGAAALAPAPTPKPKKVTANIKIKTKNATIEVSNES